MRYKNFKPLIHNFTHSFVSDCNYVDGKFVHEDIFELAANRKGAKVIVTWLPKIPKQDPELTERVLKSIEYYIDWLPQMAASLNVDIDRLVDYRTEVYLTILRKISVKAIAHDDQGREYSYMVCN